ncbi:methyltransferase domain-containing protein [Pseudanabaena sp. UWO311]|jgi:2-polyprenyl-3-methyl-5-hydroxy-6-metoxy-1,4-benzoquinol methylase|uniref:methyltransferase domain-containing protein n=1 Tax=Pseudanabaena sp. UWO311 TaxID=2487337 RepID=UPI00115C182E|nr:methyltransferase domain-containing protein [Pseudanabaena sp. UWO311]TYQ23360.1 methyltransferase domain-containing protein [Pseudanabaena sp. UWO311]
MNLSIKDQRQLAALASGGTSNYPIYTKFLNLIKQLNLKGDCLDFGAGIGKLSQQMYALNYFNSMTAADIMERPLELDKSIKWINSDLNNSLDMPDNQFDVIVSSEVIEHLENPRAIAREWFRLLRPNGTLILSTPNNESWRSLLALLFQGHFVAFGDSCYPAHITALLRKDIERIFLEVGFTSVEFTFTDYGGIPKMPQRSYQEFSFGLLKGLRYSDNLVVIAYKLI